MEVINPKEILLTSDDLLYMFWLILDFVLLIKLLTKSYTENNSDNQRTSFFRHK